MEEENRKIPVKINNGKTVTVTLYASDGALNYSVFAKTEEGEEIGSFEFRHIEEEQNEYLLLCCIFLEGKAGIFKRKGIGREILLYAKELYDIPIFAPPSDRTKSDDGCYLIGDGPGFVEKMIKEGIIRQYSYTEDYSDECF
jgi:hypothetical protein